MKAVPYLLVMSIVIAFYAVLRLPARLRDVLAPHERPSLRPRLA